MEKTNRHVAFLVPLICACALWAQPADTSATESAEDDFQRFSALPILGYSEETGLEYGAMLLLFFRPDYEDGRSTTIDFAVMGTAKNQVEALIVPRYYLYHDRIIGEAALTYDNWVSYYYGIGNDPDIDDGRMFDRTTVRAENTTLTNLGLPDTWHNFMYGPAFQLEYTDADGSKQRPVMIHRAPFGSIERFTAVVLEHTAGHLPLWLSPDQVKVLPISEKYADYAKKVCELLNYSEIRASVDARNETLGKRIREIAALRVPVLVIVGEKEVAEGTVSVRRDGADAGSMSVDAFVEYFKAAVAEELS